LAKLEARDIGKQFWATHDHQTRLVTAIQNVTLTIDSRPFDANQTIVTDANGEFIVIVTVPLDITPGNHNFTAKDDSSVEASATLAVTKTPGRQ